MTLPLRASLLVMGGLLVLDQGVKIWVRANIPLHHSTVLVPNFLDFTHVENKGVSFSMLGGFSDGIRVPLLVTISVVAVVALSYYWLRYRRSMNFFAELAFVLILAGAGGNLIDRALFGTVTDFFHFRFYDTSFFVNNIADIEISAGVVAYVIGALLRRPTPIL